MRFTMMQILFARFGAVFLLAVLFAWQPKNFVLANGEPGSIVKSESPIPAAAEPDMRTTISQIVAAENHTCVLQADHSISCWGRNEAGQTNVPAPNSGFIQVSTGFHHSCGLQADGSVVCWGGNETGSLDVPMPNNSFIQISAGYLHTCGLKVDGSVVCWGDYIEGQLIAPEPNSGFTQVSAGYLYTCGLKEDGSVVCWGRGDESQLAVPESNADFIQISAGYAHACALKVNGHVVCWGLDDHGQSSVPASESKFTHVSAGRQHACGVKINGGLVCWGDNSSWQVAVPEPNGGFTQIAAGSLHTCALKVDGSIACWGDDTNSQLSSPAPVSGGRLITHLSSGDYHNCVLKADGSVSCWGHDGSGQAAVPTPNSDFKQFSAGGSHTCAIKIDSSVVCWGRTFGPLTPPEPNNGFIQISAGYTHVCGLKIDSTIVCWGYNPDGQNNVPQSSSGFTQVSAGGYFSCGLKTDGSVLCWGYNNNSELNVPEPNSGFKQISSGSHHSCGLKVNGSIICWGANWQGQINLPTPNNSFRFVTAGWYGNCALKVNGPVVCWGDNSYSQNAVPAQNDEFTQISGGIYHYCGLKIDGATVCWGSNIRGEAPTFTFVSSGVPSGVYGKAYSWATNVTGQYSLPLVFSVYSGSLPPGLTFSSGSYSCWLQGTPNQAGTYNFSLRAVDVNGFVATKNVTLFIDKLTPTAKLRLLNTDTYYNGSPQPARAVINSSSVLGTVNNVRYNGDLSIPTNVGTYAVTADFVPKDSTIYKTLTGLPAGSFSILKATPIVSLSVTNSPVSYSGEPQEAMISSSGTPGSLHNVRYAGSTAAPTNVGTYPIIADFTPSDTNNYNSLAGLSAGSFAIEALTPVVTLTVKNFPLVYNGTAQAAAIEFSSTVPGLINNIRYSGSTTVPTNAGSYSITADFTPTDATNHKTVTDLSAGDFIIHKASPTVMLSVINSSVTYNGTPQTAVIVPSGTPGTVSDIQYNGSELAPVISGVYSISTNFIPTDQTNYNTLTSISAGDFTIEKAPLTVMADSLSRTYGASNPALTYTIQGFVNGENPASAQVTGSPVISTTVDPASPVGDYPIHISSLGSLSAPNYTFGELRDSNLVINPAVLTVIADKKSKHFGNVFPLPELTYTITGYVNGENSISAEIRGTPILSTTATVESPIGEYSITIVQNNLVAANYTFTFVNGKLIIMSRDPILIFLPIIKR